MLVLSKSLSGAWETAIRAPEWNRRPVWVHGDLDPHNVLVEEGRLCAVIDFGSLSIGDPACEVMVAWKVFSSDARDTFRSELSVDEPTRSRGWALSQSLMALSYYTAETNATLAREAHQWKKEILADPVSM